MASHLMELDRVITKMVRGEISTRRLIVSMPPRHGKSEFISKYVPAWYLGQYPNNRVFHSSYGDRFSASWGRKARNLLAEYGPDWFGVSVASDSGAANEWGVEDFDGGMVSAGVGGGITGRGANLLIVDDPVKNAEEAASEVYQEKVWDWWGSTAYTRLEPDGIAIVIMTRWHNKDLVGRILEQAEENGDAWPVLSFSAIAEEADELGRKPGDALWPDRWPVDSLNRIKSGMSAYWWNALYQQRPTQHQRCEFPAEYFGNSIWCDRWPDNAAATVVALDPSKGKSAKKGDYQAAVACGFHEGLLYVDASIERVPIVQAVDNTLRLAFAHGAKLVVFESNNFQEEAVGPVFAQRLEGNRLHGLQVRTVLHNTSKEGRIQSLDPYLRNGTLRFVRNEGCKRLVDQLREFPMASHDDGPDALETAIGHCLALLNYDRGRGVTAQDVLRQRGFV